MIHQFVGEHTESGFDETLFSYNILSVTDKWKIGNDRS